jgi:transcriptional regulator with XRE-family HTH domain
VSKQKKQTDGWNKPFPTRLRKLMEDTKTTQVALADAVGMTRQGIALYASGQTTPDIETFVKIADFFGVNYGYLLGKSGAEDKDNHNAVEQTGLSEKAVKKLKSWHELVEEEQTDGVRTTKSINTKAPEEISRLIESKHLPQLIAYIRALGYVSGKSSKFKNIILGPNRVKEFERYFGKNAAWAFIMSEFVEKTFRKIVNEIVPFTPVKDEVRQATQADMDDFF